MLRPYVQSKGENLNCEICQEKEIVFRVRTAETDQLACTGQISQEKEIAFHVRTNETEQLACTDCALKAMRDGAFIVEITDAERQSMG